MTTHRKPSTADRAAFEGVLAAWEHAGLVIPCRDGSPSVTSCWTSDDVDEQRVAARACARCPALIQCRDFGLRHKSEWGVYGGMTQEVRRPELVEVTR